MEDDLIVIDDFDSNVQGSAGPSKAADTHAAQAVTGRPQRAATLRARRQSSPSYSDSGDVTPVRPMRSSAKGKAAPKLKLKLSEKAAALAPGMSFLGPYDRELDSDDEELSFEEQFILRMPAGEDCGKLREMVAAREVSPDIWFKFKGTSPEQLSSQLMANILEQTRAGHSSTSGTICIRRNSSIFLVSSKRRRRSTTSVCSRLRTSVRFVPLYSVQDGPA